MVRQKTKPTILKNNRAPSQNQQDKSGTDAPSIESIGRNSDSNSNGNQKKSDSDRKHPLEWALGGIFALGLIVAGWTGYNSMRQTQISEEAKNLQFRPIIAFTGATIKRVGQTSSGSPTYWAITPHIQNVGAAPASEVVGRYGAVLIVGVDGQPIKTPFMDIWRPLTHEKRITTLGPGVSIPTFGMSLAAANVNDIRDDRSALGFFGRIEYSKNRVTEYCFAVALDPIDYTSPSVGEEPTIYPMDCPDHNCVDDQCPSEPPFHGAPPTK